MADRASNEYLNSTRAQKDDNDLFAAIGKQVQGLELGEHDQVDDDDRVKVVEEIESLCMNCQENGTTRLLLTKIPHFREIIIMSFFCEHCHFKNTEVQPAGQIQEQGSKYIFKVTHVDDLERQLVKSDTSILRIEELDLEVPSGRGRLTNIEGVVTEILKDLEADQKERKKESLELFEKIDVIVQSLMKMSWGAKLPFTVSLDDPAGNSWIEPSPADRSLKDKHIHQQYPRTPAQNAELGLGEISKDDSGTVAEVVPQVQADDGNAMEDVDIIEGQTYDLPVDCPGCTKPAHMLLQMVNIPYFKQVVVSTTQCDHCNYRTSDVKTGGEVPAMGKRITIKVRGPNDLKRDILKSETCMLKVPECNLEVVPGTMGGRFTSVEGLLVQIRDDLKGSIFDTGEDDILHDSTPSQTKKAWIEFFAKIDQAISAKIEYTILMEDPLANSYCETFGEPGQDDQVTSEDYERSEYDEKELGLADMKTHLNADGKYVKEPDR